MEEEGVKDLLKKVIEQNEEIMADKKNKQFKLPFSSRVNFNKAKKGYATIQILRNNGVVDFKKAKIDEDGCVIIDGFPRLATAEYRLVYKNSPMYIIPEWSMKPISLVDNYSETEKERMNIAGRRTILAKLEREKIKERKPMGNILWWIIGGIIVLGAIYYFSKGGF